MKKIAFCIDSDGCAMDTMTYKHQLFFGPLAADVFDIKDREAFLAEWDRVNLYSRTRGVNRFVGLLMGLEFAGVKEIADFKVWVETTTSLSNASLEATLAKHSSADCLLALEWSKKVNQAISGYQGEVKAFEGVQETLKKMAEMADIYIVSSANKEAVLDEWEEQGLLPYVTELYCQDRGKKGDILQVLLAKGYQTSQLLMIGDSPGDLSAAAENQVPIYPILVNHEQVSWATLREQVLLDFMAGRYDKQSECEYVTQFWNNLDKGGK